MGKPPQELPMPHPPETPAPDSPDYRPSPPETPGIPDAPYPGAPPESPPPAEPGPDPTARS